MIQLNRVEKKRTAKRDSGGIALYIRQSFYRYCTLFAKDSDDIIWIKIKGQLFNLPHDLYLCLCCIIPVSSSRAALVEMDVLDRIPNYIIKIANDTNDCYNILINSRVGNEKDYVVFDNDANIEILPIDYNIDVHIPRFSQDSIVNILTSTKNASLIITDFSAMIYKNEQPRTASLCKGWAILENDFNLICR